MSGKLQRALNGAHYKAVWLVEIDHPDGLAWFNSGYRNLDHDVGDGARVWIGTGSLGSVEFAPVSPAIEVSEFKLSLALPGSDWDYLASVKLRGRQVRVFLAAVAADGSVIDHELVEDGIMDRPALVTGENRRIEIYALGNFAFLARQSVERWTPEHQRALLTREGIDPDSDTGFDEQHGIPQTQVSWFWP